MLYSDWQGDGLVPCFVEGAKVFCVRTIYEYALKLLSHVPFLPLQCDPPSV
jgi:hypothetical protein